MATPVPLAMVMEAQVLPEGLALADMAAPVQEVTADTVLPAVAAVLAAVASELEEVMADMAADDDNFQEGYI